jgi:hypothetical protein
LGFKLIKNYLIKFKVNNEILPSQFNENRLQILHTFESNLDLTQGQLKQILGVSLGKAQMDSVLVKMGNLSHNPKK